MPVRVRCPECQTVQDVPTGSKPKCPKCGFAGRTPSPAAPEEGVKFERVPKVEWDQPKRGFWRR